MKRSDLEHIIRAASTVTHEKEFIIIGSQSILGKVPDAPRSLRHSPEADMYPRYKPALADEVDGSLGELTRFHDTNGYYAHGIAPETAILPPDWKTRLIKVQNENTNDAIGWCLDPHDLAYSKLAAGRSKDLSFIAEMLRHKIIKRRQLDKLIEAAPEELRENPKIRFQRIEMTNAQRKFEGQSDGPSSSPGSK
jgi:hypothetical protein